MLFTEALEKYEKFLRSTDRAERTVIGYFQDLKFFHNYLVEKFNCPAYLEDIKLTDIEAFLTMLKEERDYKPASRRRLSSSIKTFFTYAYKRKMCNEDIASQIETIKVPQVERDYLTEEEVIQFVDNVDNNLIKVVIWVMFYGGLRVSEALGLDEKDVDLNNRILRIIEGKGNKNRNIPINDKLFKILEDYNLWRVESEYYFATKRSGSLSRNRVAAVIRETRREMNHPKKVTPHTFRHSFASRLVKKDVNIVNVSKLMGHSNIAVTSIYTHVDPSQLQDAVNQI